MIKSLKIIQRLLLSLRELNRFYAKISLLSQECYFPVFFTLESKRGLHNAYTDIMSHKFLLMYNSCPLPLSPFIYLINKIGYLSCRMSLILDLAVVFFMVSFIFFYSPLISCKVVLRESWLRQAHFYFYFLARVLYVWCFVLPAVSCMHKISGCPNFYWWFVGSGEASLYFYQFPYWFFT